MIISTYASWLPGDPRGFRSKGHKIHSSGDYRQPPPPGEHGDIYEHAKRISGEIVRLPRAVWPIIGHMLRDKLDAYGYECLTISVSTLHAHVLVELPLDLKASKRIIGQCKTASSHAVRATLPGRVWAHDGNFDRVNDHEHQRHVYGYITKKQRPAWVWSYRAGEWFND